MTHGDAYRMAAGAEQVSSRGYSDGAVLNARHARDCKLRELWERNDTATSIAEELAMSEDQVWHAVKRLRLRRRRGSGHYGTARRRATRPNANISRVDTAARAYHLPVTIDEGADGGLICYIGDMPGDECKSLKAAVHSAVRAQG